MPLMYATLFCSVVVTFLPSALTVVRDRSATTCFAVQVCMFMSICSLLLPLHRQKVTSYNATLVFLVMVTLHVVFTMGVTLQRNEKLLVYGKMTSYYYLVMSIFMPLIWTKFISYIPDTATVVLALFLADGVAVVAVFLQVVIEAFSSHLSTAIH